MEPDLDLGSVAVEAVAPPRPLLPPALPHICLHTHMSITMGQVSRSSADMDPCLADAEWRNRILGLCMLKSILSSRLKRAERYSLFQLCGVGAAPKGLRLQI